MPAKFTMRGGAEGNAALINARQPFIRAASIADARLFNVRCCFSRSSTPSFPISVMTSLASQGPCGHWPATGIFTVDEDLGTCVFSFDLDACIGAAANTPNEMLNATANTRFMSPRLPPARCTHYRSRLRDTHVKDGLGRDCSVNYRLARTSRRHRLDHPGAVVVFVFDAERLFRNLQRFERVDHDGDLVGRGLAEARFHGSRLRAVGCAGGVQGDRAFLDAAAAHEVAADVVQYLVTIDAGMIVRHRNR